MAGSTKVGATVEVEQEIFSMIETAFQERILRETLSQRVIPSDEFLPAENINIFWDKKLADVGVGYGLKANELPNSDFAMRRVTDVIPALQAKLEWPHDEWQDIMKSRYGFNDRVNEFARDWAINQDIVAFIGNKNGFETSGTFKDTTNNTTDIGDKTNNFTTIQNVHTTIDEWINTLEDSLGTTMRGKQVQVLLTKPAYRKLTALLDTTVEFRSGLTQALETLRDRTAQNSMIDEVRMLNGSVAYNAKQVPTVTDGADGRAAIYPVDTQIIRLKQSETQVLDDPLTVKDGKFFRYFQRYKVNFREQKGTLYTGTEAITLS